MVIFKTEHGFLVILNDISIDNSESLYLRRSVIDISKSGHEPYLGIMFIHVIFVRSCKLFTFCLIKSSILYNVVTYIYIQ